PDVGTSASALSQIAYRRAGPCSQDALLREKVVDARSRSRAHPSDPELTDCNRFMALDPTPPSARPMSILMYARSLRREGGTEISSVQIARALSHRGNSVDLLYEREGQLLAEYLSFCASVTRAHVAVEKLSLREGTRIIP